jgi:hypothetical protein
MAQQHEQHDINDNYLWDASGQPDPEIQRLERVLRPFRHSGSIPPLPMIGSIAGHSGWWSEIVPNVWALRLVAALLLLALIGSGLWLSRAPSNPPAVAPQGWAAQNGWEVEVTAASQPSGSGETPIPLQNKRLQPGETLETDALSKASVAVAEIGRLQVEPMTRLRLLQSGASRKRVALDRGTIHATIWAPPGQFVVDTPSAVAVDLGCMYTLHVDDFGNGVLRTTLGWVGFHRNGRESFIPAGAACATHVQSGPGTPYFEDASDAFRSALAQLDASELDPATRKSALDTVLREARVRDALTLWHLLARVNSAERSAIYERLAALVPTPPGVTRDGILRLDIAMLDSWWNALDLGDISVWRHWEQSWTGHEGRPN